MEHLIVFLVGAFWIMMAKDKESIKDKKSIVMIESTPQIENLRIKIIKNEIENICKIRHERERSSINGYDVEESIMAISHYSSIALKIQVKTTDAYIKTLERNVAYARQNCLHPGEYNGAKSTYVDLQNNFTRWYEEENIKSYSRSKLLQIVAKQVNEKVNIGFYD